MITLNTVGNTSNVANTQSAAARPDAKTVNAQVNTGASTVVNLQTNVDATAQKSDITVDASNAKSVVVDIAALLSKSTGSVQANMNGFDAARLLAQYFSK